MSPQDVCVLSCSEALDAPLLEDAIQVAAELSAHLTHVAIAIMPHDMAGGRCIDGVPEYVSQIGEDMERVTAFHARERARLEALCPQAAYQPLTEFAASLRQAAGAAARASYLNIVRGGDWDDSRFRKDILLGALLEGARPVLVLPERWDRRPLTGSILVAWDGSQEVCRAIEDALPLLRSASAVRAVHVGPAVRKQSQQDADLLSLLGRHGVKAEIIHVGRKGFSVANRLEVEAAAFDAGLIVMGGYSISATREAILGGTSHSLLGTARRPVLMVH